MTDINTDYTTEGMSYAVAQATITAYEKTIKSLDSKTQADTIKDLKSRIVELKKVKEVKKEVEAVEVNQDEVEKLPYDEAKVNKAFETIVSKAKEAGTFVPGWTTSLDEVLKVAGLEKIK